MLTGCGNASTGPEDQPLVIFAAASLQGVFDEMSVEFTKSEAGQKYSVAPIVYDGSQALATQIVEGADVDVIAFANQSSLEPVTAAGRSSGGTVFATNTLQIAVAPGNPKHVESLADLAKPGIATVLCAPEVPCGKASEKLLDDAGVQVAPVSEETNVTSVVTRVRNGEADAGLVYQTDVAAAGNALTGVTPSNAAVAINRYPIAVATRAPSPTAAQAFTTFVLSPAGRKILADYGFGLP
ncbi:MAG: molybdate ABC transporter substrate-binding protein [Gordonia sp. (in: high G+C Gram-positive bacteria)]